MGASHSSSKGQVISKTPPSQQQQQQHQQQPQHGPPYPGPAAEYRFVNTDVRMSTQQQLFSAPMVSSNIDAYYPALAQQMAQGFRLLSFYNIPGQVKQTGGFFSMDVLMPFQGIFCRYPTAPSHQQFQLKIEKSVIQPQMVWSGIISTGGNIATDCQHLFQTIAANTANGGRLICIELTGHQEYQGGFGMNSRMPILGCDLFFELPVGPPTENYVYNIVSAPMTLEVQFSFTSSVRVHCDWNGILAHNLSQGYKLVEIFLDKSQFRKGAFTSSMQMNTQWYFEKPASRMHDPSPMYQGTVVEHWISMHQGFTGVKTTANWEPVIQDMGNQGWELACILETPEMKVSGFGGSSSMKCMMFFQRPMFPQPAGAYPPPAYPLPPPQYPPGADSGNPPYPDSNPGNPPYPSQPSQPS